MAMSRIITDMRCDSCGTVWHGYISFGHPESNFDYIWTCEGCGCKNKQVVKAWVDITDQSGCNDVEICRDDPTTIVRIFMGHDILRSFQFTDFEWREYDGEDAEPMTECFGGYLTLEDIGDQIRMMLKSAHVGVIYVWVEHPLDGVIYQYGNYSDDIWRKHGKTNGYA